MVAAIRKIATKLHFLLFSPCSILSVSVSLAQKFIDRLKVLTTNQTKKKTQMPKCRAVIKIYERIKKKSTTTQTNAKWKTKTCTWFFTKSPSNRWYTCIRNGYIAFIYSRPPINACYDCDRKINELRAFDKNTAKTVSVSGLKIFAIFCLRYKVAIS